MRQVIHTEHPAFADDGQLANLGRGEPVDRQESDGPIRQTYDTRQKVFAGAVDTLLRLSKYAHNLRTADITHDVEVVDCQINHYSHINDPSWERPLAASIELEHATELTAVQALLERHDSRVEALDMPHHQVRLPAFCSIDQLLSLVHRESEGLLDQDMDAPLQRLQAHFEMCHGRHGDGDGLRLLRVEQMLDIGVGPTAEPPAQPFGRRHPGIRDAYQLDVRQF